jgi:hypothetical protein
MNSLLHRRRPLTALVAVAALLLAQALGLAHRVAHAPLVLASGAQAHEHPAQGFDAQHDEGSAECRLIDQAGHGDGAPAPTVVADVPRAGREALRVAAPAFVAQAPARAYHARGPPPFLA